MVREWPWAARMRYWAGSSEEVEVEDVGAEMEASGMSVNRFLAFWATISRSSGKVTFMERRRFQESYGFGSIGGSERVFFLDSGY